MNIDLHDIKSITTTKARKFTSGGKTWYSKDIKIVNVLYGREEILKISFYDDTLGNLKFIKK